MRSNIRILMPYSWLRLLKNKYIIYEDDSLCYRRHDELAVLYFIFAYSSHFMCHILREESNYLQHEPTGALKLPVPLRQANRYTLSTSISSSAASLQHFST